MRISCGSIGFDGAAPMLRNSEPLDFSPRRICAAHSRHHCKYDSRSCVSEYLRYLIPRLYGGEVTTRSTLRFGNRDIPLMQSSRRRSNPVITRIWRDYVLRTSRKWPAHSISGEHRLPACPFRQPAEKLFERSMTEVFSTRGKVVGKLPTTTG